jgi:DnaJ like chaperone protein
MPWTTIKQAIGLGEGGVLRAALDALLPSAAATGGGTATRSVKFTIAVISLAAKLSKADGVASDIEARTFELVFRAPEDEAANVRRVFELAQQDVAGFEAYADQISRLLEDEPDLKRDVLDSLLMIAAADGLLHGDEDVYLREVARRLGLTDAQYRRARSLFVRDADDPYTVLGVGPDIGDTALARRYKELVREHHPDRLLAHGVPPEFVAVADRKLAAINVAYDQIRRERGR